LTSCAGGGKVPEVVLERYAAVDVAGEELGK
jgi:hypothetical protein